MKSELLAPAGSIEGMRAAIAAGADAVYMGGELFGARAYANNPEEEGLKEAIDYVHLHKKKLYLTVNTLLKNKELKTQLYDYIAPFYEQGLDAVIVQDFGVLTFLKKEFPKLPLHASTQMAVTGAEGARLLKKFGVSRVVTARELSLSEIKEIDEQTGVEIESFIHGALCYSYSGMCLFSSMLGGRSGNRGRCAQPCRLPYKVECYGKKTGSQKEKYPLSLKDMCTIELLPEILNAGVYSLKIEGRMKKPEYAAGVTRIYRKYLDLYEKNPASYHVEKSDFEELLELYQRDGFSQGYYRQHNGRNMVALENLKQQKKEKGVCQRDEALFHTLKKEYTEKKLQEKINGTLMLYTGAPAILDLEYDKIRVSVEGDRLEMAQNQALTQERIRKQMMKTGNTPFYFENLEIQTDEQGFLPMQSLNELRRKGLSLLEEQYLNSFKRTLPEKTGEQNNNYAESKSSELETSEEIYYYASVETREQLSAVLERPEITGVYFDSTLVWGNSVEQKLDQIVERIHKKKKEAYLMLPYILRKEKTDQIRKLIEYSAERLEGFLIRNVEELGLLEKMGLLNQAVCDFSLYTMNDESKCFFDKKGVKRTTIPLELNESEIKKRENSDSEMIIYGYYPMMISAQCLKKTCERCEKKTDIVTLTDRYKSRFRTKTVCDFCYNVIYNSIPTGFLQEEEKIKKLGIKNLRISLTTERKQESKELLELFLGVYKNKKNVPKNVLEFTKGHFKRGVE